MAEPTGSIIRMPKVINSMGMSTIAAPSQQAVTTAIDGVFMELNSKLDESVVVQSAGSSTTNVMSQKAVTDAFQPKGDYVDKTSSGEQIIKSNLAVSGAIYVTSAGAGSDLLEISTRDGVFSFRKRISGVYKGIVKVPTEGGTIALVEQTIGVGQSWKNVTSSRSVGVTYTNSSSKPIMVNIYGKYKTAGIGNVLVDGVVVTAVGGSVSVDIARATAFIVPAGSKYMIDKDINVSIWSELS